METACTALVPLYSSGETPGALLPSDLSPGASTVDLAEPRPEKKACNQAERSLKPRKDVPAAATTPSSIFLFRVEFQRNGTKPTASDLERFFHLLSQICQRPVVELVCLKLPYSPSSIAGEDPAFDPPTDSRGGGAKKTASGSSTSKGVSRQKTTRGSSKKACGRSSQQSSGAPGVVLLWCKIKLDDDSLMFGCYWYQQNPTDHFQCHGKRCKGERTIRRDHAPQHLREEPNGANLIELLVRLPTHVSLERQIATWQEGFVLRFICYVEHKRSLNPDPTGPLLVDAELSERLRIQQAAFDAQRGADNTPPVVEFSILTHQEATIPTAPADFVPFPEPTVPAAPFTGMPFGTIIENSPAFYDNPNQLPREVLDEDWDVDWSVPPGEWSVPVRLQNFELLAQTLQGVGEVTDTDTLLPGPNQNPTRLTALTQTLTANLDRTSQYGHVGRREDVNTTDSSVESDHEQETPSLTHDGSTLTDHTSLPGSQNTAMDLPTFPPPNLEADLNSHKVDDQGSYFDEAMIDPALRDDTFNSSSSEE